MAYRKRSRSYTAGQLIEVTPIWRQKNTASSNCLLHSLLWQFGITDALSYFSKLRILLVICVTVGACIGAAGLGLKGLLMGGLLGVVAPYALLWLGVMLTMVSIFLASYFAVWALIICFVLLFFGR